MRVSLFQPNHFCNADMKNYGMIILIVFTVFICMYIFIFKILVPAWCYNFPGLFKRSSGNHSVMSKKANLCDYSVGRS